MSNELYTQVLIVRSPSCLYDFYCVAVVDCSVFFAYPYWYILPLKGVNISRATRINAAPTRAYA